MTKLQIKKEYNTNRIPDCVDVTMKDSTGDSLTLKIKKRKVYFVAMVDNTGNNWYINKKKLKELLEMV